MLLLAGCFSGEEPAPPHEALARAAQRIDEILRQDRASNAEPTPSEPSESPPDATQVTFWFPAHALFSELMLLHPAKLAAFHDAHPGVKLSHQFIGEWNVAIQKLTVSLAAGDLPDVVVVKRAWLARLATSGRIAPLDTLLPTVLTEDFRPPARETLMANGRLYALPADGFCSVLYYNRAVVGDAPPATWEDLRGRAREVNHPSEDLRNAVYAIGDLPFLETLWAAGGDVCGGQSSGLAAPQAREAMDFILGLRDEQLIHPRSLGDPLGALQLFFKGRVAMTVASSSLGLEKAGFPYGMAPVPGKTGPVSMLSDNVMVVFARYAEAKRDAIVQVLDFLTGPEVQDAGALASGSVPTRKSVAQGLSVPAGLDQAFLHGRNTPLVGPWSAIEFELARCLDLAYRWKPPQSYTSSQSKAD